MYLRCGYRNNSFNVPLVTLLVRHAYGPCIIELSGLACGSRDPAFNAINNVAFIL